MERKTKADIFIISFEHDNCGGFFFFTNQVKPGIERGSQLFTHKCNKCGAIRDLKKVYPGTSIEKQK